MIIKSIKKRFHFLPIFSITKHVNALSERAKKDFGLEWDYYYTIEIGWLFWSNF